MDREMKEKILEEYNVHRHLRRIWEFVVAAGKEFGFEKEESKNPGSDDLEQLYNQATESYIILNFMFRQPPGDPCIGGKVQMWLG